MQTALLELQALNAILAFANGDWGGMEDSMQPPVKVA